MKGTSIIVLVVSLVFSFENADAQTWSGATPGNIYYNSGNVGIGTDTPLDKLHVNGNLSLKPDEATTPSYINFKRVSDGWIPARIGQAYAQQGYGGHLIFETNASGSTTNLVERMRITHTGYVGIGTANPGHKLQINDGALQIVNPGVSTSYSLIFRDEDTANSSYFFHRKTPNYQILGSNKNGTGVLRKIGFAVGGGDDEADVKMTLDQNGNLLINKTTQVNTAYKLDVNGSIRSNEIVVNTTGADFVFADNYKLRPLEEVEEFITANNHLPDVAPASEMEQNGLELGKMDIKLLQKVEELTLYMIELKKEVQELKKENAKLKKTIDELDQK